MGCTASKPLKAGSDGETAKPVAQASQHPICLLRTRCDHQFKMNRALLKPTAQPHQRTIVKAAASCLPPSSASFPTPAAMRLTLFMQHCPIHNMIQPVCRDYYCNASEADLPV